jgi:phospholipase/carboxylesterase
MVCISHYGLGRAACQPRLVLEIEDVSVETKTMIIEDITLQVRESAGTAPRPILLLLHGWTGDENAMWVFASRLPSNMVLVAPRGIYHTPLGGYGWYPHRSKAWPWIDDFTFSIDALLNILTPTYIPSGDFSQMHLVGFSQGAALAYAFALLHPSRVNSIVGLSGFMPDGSEAIVRNRPLLGKRVFIAHGSQDELVPVDRARSAVQLLELGGASVIYCEDDVGHKLSSSCFRGMETFFAGIESI